MTYISSQAFAGRSTILEYFSGSPSVPTIVAELKKIDFTGSKYDLADVTNFQSGNFKEWLPTLADSGELSFEGNYIPGDPSQTAVRGFFNNATLVSWQVVLPGGLGNITFLGYVVSIDYAIPVEKEATVTGKIKITGKVVTP